MKKFAKLLLEVIDEIAQGTNTREKQDESLSTYAKKIEKSDCLIDFTKPAQEVHNLIRGLSPIPLSFTHTPDGKLLKITESRYIPSDSSAAAGTVISLEGDGITVACRTGAVKLLRVLPEGKGRMSAADFIRGRKISLGDILK